jgi:hypothetical protein
MGETVVFDHILVQPLAWAQWSKDVGPSGAVYLSPDFELEVQQYALFGHHQTVLSMADLAGCLSFGEDQDVDMSHDGRYASRSIYSTR